MMGCEGQVGAFKKSSSGKRRRSLYSKHACTTGLSPRACYSSARLVGEYERMRE